MGFGGVRGGCIKRARGQRSGEEEGAMGNESGKVRGMGEMCEPNQHSLLSVHCVRQRSLDRSRSGTGPIEFRRRMRVLLVCFPI